MKKVMMALAGGAALALATAAPSSAQYPYSYGMNTQAAAQQCAAAVQSRLSTRTSGGILGVLGLGTQSRGRVLSVTRVQPRGSHIRVRGLATSNAYAAYNPYGVGAYGALGYNYAQPRADLSFKCDVDYRGYVRDVDINRR
jgi:hypothetical protein